MINKPRGSTLPSYTFAYISETAATIVITSAGSLAAKDSWQLIPGGLAPYNAAPTTAVTPQDAVFKGQNAPASLTTTGGNVVLSPGTGTGGNSSGHVKIQDTAGFGGAWNTSHLLLGPYHIWVDAAGRLRVKNSAPTSDTDGTVIGTQT